MDHYRDLTAYTTIAAETVRTKAVSDAARITAAENAAWTIMDSLDDEMREQFDRALAPKP